MKVEFVDGKPCRVLLKAESQADAYLLGRLTEIAPISYRRVTEDWISIGFDVVVVDPADIEEK